jgi:hypothetical protein
VAPAPHIRRVLGTDLDERLAWAVDSAGGLVAVELRSRQPLLAPFLFRSWAFVTANLAQLLEGVSLVVALVTVPFSSSTNM